MRRYLLCQCLTRDDNISQLPSGPETLDDFGTQLAEAVLTPGRLATAARLVSTMEQLELDPLDYIDQMMLQKVKRFAVRFEEALRLSRPDMTEPERRTGNNSEIGMSFAYVISGDYMNALCMKEFSGVDAVSGIVGYSEAQFRHKHVKGIEECAVLKSTEDSALWSQLTEVEDHVIQIELVNALDEDLGTIVHMLSYSSENSSDLFPDVPIPPPRREMHPKNYLQVIEFEPLPPGDSFRVHYAFRMLMPSTMKSFVCRSPPFLMDKMLRSAFSLWPADFEKFNAICAEEVRLAESNSTFSVFYSLCRSTLEMKMASSSGKGWKRVNSGEPAETAEPEPEASEDGKEMDKDSAG
eukprot:gnl/TRDRNA2_/TRDRNA2_165173_c0_seq4.p1 gnl/TRDRNA2_/TRDRNA2_165173_c0~~gnl/TRDRNA2_/TRDRNA2_165173_c0_seq4.p1  ORF type:complete len:353 (-),score=74.37 gnl/TRDRNA2_/TRDRNA2_165173_c0_seq4:42-1100(-)